MDNVLADYIEQNKVCSDMIFRDWNEFLDILFACGGHVRDILWFEYVLVEKQKESLGGGGYRDSENPAYMWAETMLHDECLSQKSLWEIKEHIKQTIECNKSHDLVPCFLDIG